MPHPPRCRPRVQRRSPQSVPRRGPPEPPGGPPTRCHAAPWSARLHPRTPAQRQSRSRAPIVRAFTFEDCQCWPRARHRVADDLPEFGPAEFDCRGVVRHGVILVRGAARLVLGRALMALGQPERGIDELRVALDSIRRLGHPPTLWRAWSTLGTALAQTARDDEAAAAVAAAAKTLRAFAATLAPERSGPLLAAEPSREILSAGGSS